MFQTQRQIQTLLAGAGLRPNRRLGQCFLIDRHRMGRLVDSAELTDRDVALEVGAGTGSLTSLLAERAGRVVACEVDPGLVRLLRGTLADNVTLVPADALAGKHRLNPMLLAALDAAAEGLAGRRVLVANLPYDIATPLIAELLIEPAGIERMCFTVQKEVGERLLAEPGSKTYGPVSVLTALLGRAESVASVPARLFWPRPRVDSVILRLDVLAPHRRAERDLDARQIADVVRTVFLHRRKMLRTILPDAYPPPAITGLPEALRTSPRRPEQLTPCEWAALARSLPGGAPRRSGPGCDG